MYNVLIVDDENFVRMSLKRIIDWKEFGFNIEFEADNGDTAFDIIINNQIDILITDIEMPRVGGIELLNKLKDNGINLEVIVISCHDDYENVRNSMKLGAYDYFFKATMFPEDFLKILLEVKARIETKLKLKQLFSSYEGDHELNDMELDSLLKDRSVDRQDEQNKQVTNNPQGELKKSPELLWIIMDKIRSLDINELNNTIRMVMEDAIDNKNIAIDDLQELISHIISYYFNTMLPGKFQLSKALSDHPLIFSNIYTITEADRLLDYLQATIHMVDEIAKRDMRIEMYNASEYIKEHYADYDISLDTVSDYVNMSKSHFSKLFKETYGKTFVEYLTKVRLDKAEEIYRVSNNMKIYELAKEVGYSDWRYFSNLFRSKKGEYIRKIKK